MRLIITSSIAALAVLFATNAEATPGLATATVNLRTGPGMQYASMGSIPNGVILDVAGCTAGYGWCRVNYRGIDGWASSNYIAVQTGGGSYSTNSNFGSTAAAVGIPLIAGIVIGSAINNNRWNNGPNWGPGPYGPGWGPGPYRPGWGPGPYRPGPGWRGPNQWGEPRPHWSDHPGWRDHPGYHPNFYGPGDRWRPRDNR